MRETRLQLSQSTGSLTIRALRRTDSGSYSCSVNSLAYTPIVSSPAQLTVLRVYPSWNSRFSVKITLSLITQLFLVSVGRPGRATWSVSIAERLQFLVKPKDARLAAGSDVTITCSARGASLSWRRVGVAVLPDHVTSEGGKLRLRGVRRSDAGLYVCTATAADRSQTIDTTIRIDVTGAFDLWAFTS